MLSTFEITLTPALSRSTGRGGKSEDARAKRERDDDRVRGERPGHAARAAARVSARFADMEGAGRVAVRPVPRDHAGFAGVRAVEVERAVHDGIARRRRARAAGGHRRAAGNPGRVVDGWI